jgi:hypothetical protein
MEVTTDLSYKEYTRMPTRTRTVIPNSNLSTLIEPGTMLKAVIKHPNDTTTPIICPYTEDGIYYNGECYKTPSSFMKALLIIYRSDRKTKEDRGWTSITRESDGRSLYDIRAEYNLLHN